MPTPFILRWLKAGLLWLRAELLTACLTSSPYVRPGANCGSSNSPSSSNSIANSGGIVNDGIASSSP